MDTKKLIADYLAAKAREDSAKAERQELGKTIAEVFGCKDEGSETQKDSGYKVSITHKVNRKIDWARFEEIHKEQQAKTEKRLHIPMELRPQLNNKGWKWTKTEEPEYYKALCEAVTETPGAPTVKVEEVKE